MLLNTNELARKIVSILEDKKGEEIVLLDINEITDFASYFIICSGTSVRMLDALADAVIKSVKPNLSARPRIEGKPEDGWLVLDLGDLILHLFTPDQRDYYKLEELWSNGKVLLHLQ